jgi:hypothetical protein
MIWMFIKIYRTAKRAFGEQHESSVGAFLLGSTGFFAALAVQNIACFNLMYRNQSLLVWIIAGFVALIGAQAKTAKSANLVMQ